MVFVCLETDFPEYPDLVFVEPILDELDVLRAILGRKKNSCQKIPAIYDRVIGGAFDCAWPDWIFPGSL